MSWSAAARCPSILRRLLAEPHVDGDKPPVLLVQELPGQKKTLPLMDYLAANDAWGYDGSRCFGELVAYAAVLVSAVQAFHKQRCPTMGIGRDTLLVVVGAEAHERQVRVEFRQGYFACYGRPAAPKFVLPPEADADRKDSNEFTSDCFALGTVLHMILRGRCPPRRMASMQRTIRTGLNRPR